MRAGAIGCFLLFCAAGIHANTLGSAGLDFSLQDYFEVNRIKDVSLSSDGSRVAYVVERQRVQGNNVSRVAYIQQTTAGSSPVVARTPPDAHGLAWIAHKGELAFLSGQAGVTHVFAYDTQSEETRQLTQSEDDVIDFRFAPRGGAIAYLTAPGSESLYDRLRRKGPGILIDTDVVGIADMVEPNVRPAPSALWLLLPGRRPQQVDVPGELRSFHWSPDAEALSVTYTPASMPVTRRTSVGVIDVQTKRFTPVATAVSIPGNREISYFGGEWIPGTRSFVVRRVDETNSWLRGALQPRMTIVNTLRSWRDTGAHWWAAQEMYPLDVSVYPRSSRTIYVEARHRAIDKLMTWTSDDIYVPDPLFDFPDSSTRSFRFSEDFRTVVFIKESLTDPPELYVRSTTGSSRRLTGVNVDIARRRLPKISVITWRSQDDIEISGWLMAPPDGATGPPWPLLTYVHGGPSSPFPGRFAPSTSVWPYPFEVLALNGVAVFIPQYRGTKTFGGERGYPKSMDAEPVDDVVSGIQALVRRGIADRARLGIAGHSHGAWLGAIVATRMNVFRAGSFAEGWSNQAVLFETHDGQLNREVHQRGIGELSFYEEPRRYLEMSPDLHMKNISLAALFESGSGAAAVQMLGMPKAMRHFGLPSEFVIYPATGHTVTTPSVQQESSERNFDWFRFWLLGKEDPGVTKRTQYMRWREMRSVRTQSETGGSQEDPSSESSANRIFNKASTAASGASCGQASASC